MRAVVALSLVSLFSLVACGTEDDLSQPDVVAQEDDAATEEQALLSNYGRPTEDDAECRDMNASLSARCNKNDTALRSP